MWSSCSPIVSITSLYRIIFEPSLDGPPSYIRLSRGPCASGRSQDRAEDVRGIRPAFRDDRGDQRPRRQVEEALHLCPGGPGHGIEAHNEPERLGRALNGFT